MVKNYLPNLINKEAIDVNKLFLKKTGRPKQIWMPDLIDITVSGIHCMCRVWYLLPYGENVRRLKISVLLVIFGMCANLMCTWFIHTAVECNSTFL